MKKLSLKIDIKNIFCFCLPLPLKGAKAENAITPFRVWGKNMAFSILMVPNSNSVKRLIFYGLTAFLFVGCKMSTPISPGELSSVHKHLEGTAKCTECHTRGKRISNKKCLDCHKDIDERIGEKRGFHASKEVDGEKCVKCHSDHHGKDFEIVRFDEDNFDHTLTGYNLEGAHADNKCADCHKKDFITDKDAKEKKNKTFFGLGQKCLDCHDDYHQSTLPENCLDCHNFDHYKPAEKFKHEQTDFALLGKHSEVACEKCHAVEQRKGEKFQVFAGIEFSNCTNCHEDAHENKFGQICNKCHTEESFHLIKGEDKFDHTKTNFALMGKHKNVECKTCHKGKLTDPLKHSLCTDCHIDYHKGQFVKNGKKPDCEECHNIDGFEVPQFTIAQHNKTAFPLKGAHEATPCISCHQKQKDWSFRNIGKNCVDCHDDIHKTFMSEKYYPKQSCDNCHKETKWSAVSFDHSKTKFDLQGAHKKQSCRDCHFEAKSGGKFTQKFSSLSTNCTECHDDTHYKQFEKNGVTDCARCHGFNDWQAEKFDHNNAAFKLDGKHQNVACAKCHKEVKEGSNIFTQYKIKDYRCEACH